MKLVSYFLPSLGISFRWGVGLEINALSFFFSETLKGNSHLFILFNLGTAGLHGALRISSENFKSKGSNYQ